MKNRSSKTKFLVFFALGLISCAFCVQQAQAVPHWGAITFAGGVHLADVNGAPVSSVNDATQVVSWLDGGGNMPTVQSADGIFASLVGQTATFAFSWSFNSGAITAFWTVGAYTFNLIASNIGFQGSGFLYVTGTGTITGPGLNGRPADWFFSVQDGPSGGVFSFSGGSSVPDGGATAALLGLALAGIECTRRKLMKPKS